MKSAQHLGGGGRARINHITPHETHLCLERPLNCRATTAALNCSNPLSAGYTPVVLAEVA